ncbi:hypothetical protein GCM10012275_51190 [Longimycelium tulufanense]|uniref:Tyr recombinase domain-containing protein n=1 Tax=Longimycelium tulufanense TaxID=907463 RepID=A0A8J3CCL2_9PSEU|nr:site-specific integrase [Longimycelium tulufanense]GGM74266.1 hypothetical protein GCM10012275_51190 [Longimycelium tulufanense]
MRYRVRYQTPDNRQTSKSFPDKRLEKAKAFKLQVEAEALEATGAKRPSGDILVRDYGDLYRKGRSQDESSQIRLGSLLKNQIYRFMGDLTVEEVDIDTLRDWKEWMTKVAKISASCQSQAWGTLSAMLEAAMAEGRIRSNPCRSKSISAPQPPKRKIRPWPESKLRRVERALDSRYLIVVPLGAGLGLRQGEILAFSPDDIDRNNLLYHCNRQLVYRNGVLAFKLPKGHKTRTIPIGDGVLDAVNRHMEEHPPVTITLPWVEQDGQDYETAKLLIATPRDTAWIPQMFSDDVWVPAFEAAQLRYEKRRDGMHALRHLFASHMLAQGVTIKELAEYLGHSSEAFTLRTYVHLMPSSHTRARQAANALFSPGSSG